MKYLFPYNKIEKNSKIALYGAGKVGKEFYLQMQRSNYGILSVWVDKSFDNYAKVNAPFAYVADLLSYEFDYIIIAIASPNMAKYIQNTLLEMGISEKRIVWAKDYEVRTDVWPMNKARVLENFDFYKDIFEKYHEANSIYGGGKFYQSYTELGIEGTRNTQERITLYRIQKFLSKDSSVLDIGCNCGFLDLQVSPYVGQITGIDIDPLFIDIAKRTQEHMRIENAEFICEDFYQNTSQSTYDAVFSFAVHSNIMISGASEREFVDCIYGKLKHNGYLFFESHNVNSDRERYMKLCNMFVDKGMCIRLHENYFSDFERDIIVLQK